VCRLQAAFFADLADPSFILTSESATDHLQRITPLRARDSINAGQIPGPRVLAAGIWVGRKDGVCEFGGIGIAGGAEGFRQRVRDNIAAGADVIKVCVTGWPADAFANAAGYELPDSTLAAQALGLDSLGRIAPGMAADIVAVAGDPLTDAVAFQRVRFVMSRGKVVLAP